MVEDTLKNKPLIEAIFQYTWEFKGNDADRIIDPNYQLLVGRLFDRMIDDYPYHETLPTAGMPEEISAHVAQHRFRKSNSEWPLIQVGPGIITLNDTKDYIWDDFFKRIERLLVNLNELNPDIINADTSNIILRYIDAIDYDYSGENIVDFLKSQMKIDIEVKSEIFEQGLSNKPANIDLKFSFPSEEPTGLYTLRLFRGTRNNVDSFIWETIMESTPNMSFKSTEEILDWTSKAHDLTHNLFFTLIKGDLMRRFQ